MKKNEKEGEEEEEIGEKEGEERKQEGGANCYIYPACDIWEVIFKDYSIY